MVDRQLRSYVQRQLKAGYSSSQLRPLLLEQGYSSSEVDSALGKTSAPHKPHHFLFVVVGVLVVIVGVLGFFLVTQESVPSQLLDVETEPTTVNLQAGDDLTFTVQLTNLGSQRRYDVLLTHILVDQLGVEVVTQEESVAIETRASKTSRISLPRNLESANYRLRTVARYNGQQADASFTFSVAKLGESVPTAIFIPSLEAPAAQLEASLGPAELDQITTLAVEDSSLALQLCTDQFEEQSLRDGCNLQIALTLGDESVCERIENRDKRDSCYVTIVLDKGDFSLCSRIQDANLRTGCNSLR